MPNGYRKIKFFTEQEAEKFCDNWNGNNRRTNMVGSNYDTEKTEQGWIINHYVFGQIVSSYAKNGILPHDYDEDYLEGYIKNA